MDFKDYLKKKVQKVNQALDQILLEFVNETKKTNPRLLPFAKELVNSCKGGKRIRGVLCKLGYELASSKLKIQSSKLDNEIFKIGAAFEILHTALLIHDDIIDQSPTRRDQPSLYTALGGDHYGISQAISIGDIGLYLPIKIITQTSFSAEVKLKTLDYFSQILINTGWGQVMDISKDRDKDFVNLFKTAKYTIAGPLQIGAILAGANDDLIKKLGEFGENAGIAFQIQDDILDGEVSSSNAHSQALDYASKAQKLIPKITRDDGMGKLLEEMTRYLVDRSK